MDGVTMAGFIGALLVPEVAQLVMPLLFCGIFALALTLRAGRPETIVARIAFALAGAAIGALAFSAGAGVVMRLCAMTACSGDTGTGAAPVILSLAVMLPLAFAGWQALRTGEVDRRTLAGLALIGVWALLLLVARASAACQNAL